MVAEVGRERVGPASRVGRAARSPRGGRECADAGATPPAGAPRGGGGGVRRVGAVLAVLLGGAFVALSSERPADLILRNGKVVTMDPARPSGTAIAVSGDR